MFVKLTMYNGEPLYVNPAHVVSFYTHATDAIPNVRTAISTVETEELTLVCENVERVRTLLEGAS